MNNVAVAALMLPVVMDIARKTKRSPSTLLMPLAYGSLLGGLTTMIGTPPNILVTEALRENGLTPFFPGLHLSPLLERVSCLNVAWQKKHPEHTRIFAHSTNCKRVCLRSKYRQIRSWWAKRLPKAAWVLDWISTW